MLFASDDNGLGENPLTTSNAEVWGGSAPSDNVLTSASTSLTQKPSILEEDIDEEHPWGPPPELPSAKQQDPMENVWTSEPSIAQDQTDFQDMSAYDTDAHAPTSNAVRRDFVETSDTTFESSTFKRTPKGHSVPNAASELSSKTSVYPLSLIHI